VRALTSIERAAAGRPSRHSRALWLSLALVVGVGLLVAVPLAYRSVTSADERERRTVSKTQYEQLVRSSYARVQRAFRATDVPVPRLAQRVAAAQEALRAAADRLDAVVPPAEVRAEHTVIVDGLREYADDLEEVRLAAIAGDTQRIAAFNRRVGRNPAVTRIAEAAESMLYEKGYDIGPIAED
jgi:hypothetical protein